MSDELFVVVETDDKYGFIPINCTGPLLLDRFTHNDDVYEMVREVHTKAQASYMLSETEGRGIMCPLIYTLYKNNKPFVEVQKPWKKGVVEIIHNNSTVTIHNTIYENIVSIVLKMCDIEKCGRECSEEQIDREYMKQ